MTEYTTSARGDRIAYDLRGAGPAIVFVAGAGPFRAVDPITTETAERAAALGVTTLVFDRLGRGESDGNVDADSTGQGGNVLDLDREIEAIRAVIEAAGGAAVLCGHSSGCSISIRAAAAGLPVIGLALWEGPLANTAAHIQEWSDEFERRLDAGDLGAAQEQYMRDMPPEWLAGAKASPAWESIIAAAPSLRADSQSMAWATAALENGGLSGIRMPVLAMFGTETFPEMPTAAGRIAATVPGTIVKEMPGAQHSWDPESMAAELAAFAKACAVRD